MILKLDGVGKKYGTVWALKPTTIVIDKGITAIVGPNGAGKTTTLGIISGYIEPTVGAVEYYKKGDFRKWIRIIMAESNLPRDVVVKNYLMFVGGITGNLGRLKDIVEITEIGDMLNKYIGHLSTGYKKRVAIASALLSGGEFIVADEPFAGLDPQYRREIRDIFYRLYKELDISFLISSHNLQDMEVISDRILTINSGVIRDMGSINDVEKAVLLVSNDFPSLISYLKEHQYDVIQGKSYVVVKTYDINKLLGVLGNSPVEINNIQTVTLEEVMIDVE